MYQPRDVPTRATVHTTPLAIYNNEALAIKSLVFPCPQARWRQLAAVSLLLDVMAAQGCTAPFGGGMPGVTFAGLGAGLTGT